MVQEPKDIVEIEFEEGRVLGTSKCEDDLLHGKVHKPQFRASRFATDLPAERKDRGP
jgi:hypothetical protein